MNIIWHTLGAITLWYLGLYLGLQGQRRHVLISAVFCIVAAICWLGSLCLRYLQIAPYSADGLYCSVAFLALIAAAVMLLVVRALSVALSFALATVAMSILLLMTGAAFLMAALLVIYAGAIVVTFLFVIMLAQQRGLPAYDTRPREPLLACLAGWAITLCLVLVSMALTDKNNHSPRDLEHSGQSRQDYRTLVQTIRAMEQALETLMQVMEQQKSKSRDELVEVLDVRAFDGITFTKAIESLRRQRVKSQNRRMLQLLGSVEHNYQSLLEAIATNPPDYGSARAAASSLIGKLQDYRNVLEGARALTSIGKEPTARGLGVALFGYYAFPVPLAGFLLLLATIGAFIIGQSSRTRMHQGEPIYERHN